MWKLPEVHILSEKLTVSGYGVREGVRAFFSNGRISAETKDVLASFLSSIPQADIAEMFVTSTVLEGQARVEGLWRRGFASALDGDAKGLAVSASLSCSLRFDDRFRTLTAHYIDQHSPELFSQLAVSHGNARGEGGTQADAASLAGDAAHALVIFANPLFAAMLTDESFTSAVAHEFYHHRDNHYKTIAEMTRLELSKNPALGEKEKLLIRGLAEDAIDCIANDALGIDRMEIEARPDAPGYGRRLLCTAAAAGQFLCEGQDGVGRGQPGLYIPLTTRARLEARYTVKIPKNTTPEAVLRILVDSCASGSGLGGGIR